MTFMKPRALPPGTNRSFSTQARATANANRRESFRGPVEGEYNSFRPSTEKALWFAMCPDQSWDNIIYDREQHKVVTLEGQYWFTYVQHYIAKAKKAFHCSAGPHKDKPCWGCGVRNAHYEKQREIQERTGVRPKGEAPLSAGMQNALSGALLENMVKVPKLDANGKPRLRKDGSPIINETPLTMLPMAEQLKHKKNGDITFGQQVHYSFGTQVLNELLGFDEQLKNSCANCAADMCAVVAHCPECAAEYPFSDDPSEPISGQDLLERRREDFKCDCGYYGPLLPQLQCECGDPQEGALVHFALRLKTEITGENQRSLRLTEIRPIGYFTEKYPVVTELLRQPLDLPKIFSPTSLQLQSKMMPPEYMGDGVTPEARKTKGATPAAESYSFGGKTSAKTAAKREAAFDDDDIPY